MNNEFLGGLDEVQEEKEEVVVSLEEHKKKRRPFHEWKIGETTYKLKLKTGMIERLENKYRENLLNLISKEGLPPLSVMLTIIQAAMQPWQHNVDYKGIQAMYDSWVDKDGGNQMELLNKVVIPTMAVSGFFTPDQAENIMEQLDEVMDTSW